MTVKNRKARRQENSIKNPGAAVVIYNYKHRLGTFGLSEAEAHEIDQLILNTVSLRKVSTTKSKSQAAGGFEIHLAPTKNWVQTITPGSWCVILMSQEKITAKDTKYNNPKGEHNKVKMLGRIESVRAVTAVDQKTGAITTEYVAQGEDWGGVLNTLLYIDPLIRGRADAKAPIGSAENFIYNKLLAGYGKDGLPTSSDNIKTLLTFWGRTSEARSNIKIVQQSLGRLSESKNQFRFPKELAKYFDWLGDDDKGANALADIIEVVHGKLEAPDYNPEDKSGGNRYKPVDDGAAPLMLDSILGTNSFWQLIVNNSNHWLNDTYPEMRWEYNDKTRAIRPKLVIYNRIKPFTINSEQYIRQTAIDEGKLGYEPKKISDFISKFKDVRTYKIDRSDLMLVNVGTNWRDRYNFIEVNVSSNILGGTPANQTYDTETKSRNQTFDDIAIGRDGFKPMIVNAKFIPKNENGTLDPFRVLEYKTMNREWFFNIHRMMNGSMTLVGQENYVAVGDNLLIDADAIFPGRNANLDHIENRGKAYFLAHIESVGHSCTVNENGARSFITEIQFVRGIIVDENGKLLENSEMLDEDVHGVSSAQELNSNRVFGTSSGKDGKSDPDAKKLRGK